MGKDCVVVTVSNPISRPIDIDRITIRLDDPEHLITVTMTDAPSKGPQQVPCPVSMPLRCHGRENLPTYPDDVAIEAPRVSLIGYETHTWWALNLRDPDDSWFERLRLIGIDYEIIYHSHMGGSRPMKFSASQETVEMLRGLKKRKTQRPQQT